MSPSIFFAAIRLSVYVENCWLRDVKAELRTISRTVDYQLAIEVFLSEIDEWRRAFSCYVETVFIDFSSLVIRLFGKNRISTLFVFVGKATLSMIPDIEITRF